MKSKKVPQKLKKVRKRERGGKDLSLCHHMTRGFLYVFVALVVSAHISGPVDLKISDDDFVPSILLSSRTFFYIAYEKLHSIFSVLVRPTYSFLLSTCWKKILEKCHLNLQNDVKVETVNIMKEYGGDSN
jgi:hypothetical protein